ncbi:hypothetical protein EDE08_104498 [Bradyrhizobium sp. R2.2-H]|nr:hypothetical protein EDE08_104498 [Bradyrhizobium sp. R2.2-H]
MTLFVRSKIGSWLSTGRGDGPRVLLPGPGAPRAARNIPAHAGKSWRRTTIFQTILDRVWEAVLARYVSSRTSKARE